jgi:DNA-binding LytR/AlgR family response regulator
MAMKIAIVDDDSAFRENFADLAQNNTLSLPVNVIPFANGDSLLLSPLASFDAFFLDVYLGSEDGISLAKTLQKEVGDPLLVFVTSSLNRAVDAFSLAALHYLVKPLEQSKVDEALFRVNQECEKKAKKIVFENKEGLLSVRLSDLLYIESFGNDKFFKLKDKSFSLQGARARRCSRFFKAIRASTLYPVPISSTFEYVDGLQGDFLALSNGEKLPIPQQRKKEIAEAFLAYLHS